MSLSRAFSMGTAAGPPGFTKKRHGWQSPRCVARPPAHPRRNLLKLSLSANSGPLEGISATWPPGAHLYNTHTGEGSMSAWYVLIKMREMFAWICL